MLQFQSWSPAHQRSKGFSCKRCPLQISERKSPTALYQLIRVVVTYWSTSPNSSSCEMVFKEPQNMDPKEVLHHYVLNRHVTEALQVVEIWNFKICINKWHMWVFLMKNKWSLRLYISPHHIITFEESLCAWQYSGGFSDPYMSTL